jgi:hypothetical protein
MKIVIVWKKNLFTRSLEHKDKGFHKWGFTLTWTRSADTILSGENGMVWRVGEKFLESKRQVWWGWGEDVDVDVMRTRIAW